MKKLFIGLLALGTFSSFAGTSYEYKVNYNDSRGHFKILSAQEVQAIAESGQQDGCPNKIRTAIDGDLSEGAYNISHLVRVARETADPIESSSTMCFYSTSADGERNYGLTLEIKNF